MATELNAAIDYLLGKTDKQSTDDSNNITFDHFTSVFYNESKELTEVEKENLLDMVRIFNKRRLERQERERK